MLLSSLRLGPLRVHLRGRVRFGLLRALTDYTVILAPLNALMYLFSRLNPKPYARPEDSPELAPLQANWERIREEALRLQDDGRIRAATGYNDIGFNSFFRTGWKRFYLKWYGRDMPSALDKPLHHTAPGRHSGREGRHVCPPPGSRLVRHRDPYAGSLRYHLGLVTPNSPDCYIEVDGQRYHWKDGEGIVFDETFIHFAENKTEHPASCCSVTWSGRFTAASGRAQPLVRRHGDEGRGLAERGR